MPTALWITLALPASLMMISLFLPTIAQRWQSTMFALGAQCLVSAALLLWVASGAALPSGAELRWLNLTGLSLTLLLLISLIGLVVTRFSSVSLRDEPGQCRFLNWLTGCILAVSVTVTANHLLVLLVGWIAISLCFHHLLLFYPERPRAQLAAHKKFIFARLSEALLLLAAVLLSTRYDSLWISDILARIAQTPELSGIDHAAAISIALAALIKCAQLPVHGWLIQVVEAPTPVSALLHAGIINLGGFLLILFAPLFSASAPAQWLVLVVAGGSAALAALIMITRISIKVRLAWSTVAQMGLMLVECALGLYHIALLHLVAHSCYKAHAFLNSGNAVSHYLQSALSNYRRPTPQHWLLASALIVPATAVLLTMNTSGLISPWLIIGFALLTACAHVLANRGRSTTLHAGVWMTAGLTTYGVLAWIMTLLLGPAIQSGILASLAQDLFAGLMFTGVMALYLALQNLPPARVRKLFVMLHAGFYLDEWATRLTLKLWPVTLPDLRASTHHTVNTNQIGDLT